MKSFSVLALFFFCTTVTTVGSERYVLDYDESANPLVKNALGETLNRRDLQIETGNLEDINATDDTCRVVGSSLQCFIRERISANDGTWSDFDVTLFCPTLDPFFAFDFRRQTCNCAAKITTNEGNTKNCLCQTCPYDYGRSPISIDCEEGNKEDPFVISTCASLDCDFGCNGTCSFDCSNPTPECLGLCEAAGGPTSAPTGTAIERPGTSGTRGTSALVIWLATSLFAMTSVYF